MTQIGKMIPLRGENMAECKCSRCGNFKEKEESAFEKWYSSSEFPRYFKGARAYQSQKYAWNAALDAVLDADCLWKFIVGGKFKVGAFKVFIEDLKEC